MTGTMLPFTKMQAVGNDFVVLDTADWPGNSDWPALAIRLCDRKFGVGADGLLVVGPSAVADLRMQMFNPDGTEDMCGNGLRCVVRQAYDRGTVHIRGLVQTLAGVRLFGVLPDGNVLTEMGSPRFAPAEIPVCAASHRDIAVTLHAETRYLDAVNTGTTHAVVWCDTLPDDETFLRWSPFIEHHPLFPDRTSIMWAVVEGPDTLRLRIWERGAGETLGCGTGACAAAVLAIETGRTNKPIVNVVSRGGTLTVDWSKDTDNRVTLTGTAHTVYRGKVARDG